jgi:5-methylcytosine-specific restriction endonuclease McrA
MTRFEEHYTDDAATVEHIYHRRHPRRRDASRHLPSVVLACRRCNNERGAPEAQAFDVCPVIAAEGKRRAV